MGAKLLNVRWVRRNRPPAPVPFMISEDSLPCAQRVLVFLPHSDDGRYFGGTLGFMREKLGERPRNAMRIVVVSPGWRGVHGQGSVEEKAETRWQETLQWAQSLGFSDEQLCAFRADRTYLDEKGVHREDQSRMDELVRQAEPTLVFVPHISDTAQHINYNSRRMVMQALRRYLSEAQASGDSDRDLLLLEYPTNHVPFLPPSDKNLMVVFSDPQLANTKHRANDCHKSQEKRGFDLMVRLWEGATAFADADVVRRLSERSRRLAHDLGDVSLDPMRHRIEHFGITHLGIQQVVSGPIIVETRPSFPPEASFLARWQG